MTQKNEQNEFELDMGVESGAGQLVAFAGPGGKLSAMWDGGKAMAGCAAAAIGIGVGSYYFGTNANKIGNVYRLWQGGAYETPTPTPTPTP